MQRTVVRRIAAWTVLSPLAIGLITVALLGATIGLAVYSDALAREAGTRQAMAQAAILSRSLTGPIAFDDTGVIRENIAAVKADPAIKALGAYNAAGRLLAGFVRGAEVLPSFSRASDLRITDGRVEVRRAVVQSSTTIGFIYLASEPTSRNQRLLRFTGVAATAVLATILGVVLAASFAALAGTNRRLKAEIESRRVAEEALVQARKMEAMGQLTGGVAHDFNNLLTPIVATLDMLQRRDIGGPRERRLIDAAAQSADRARLLVQRLLAFARRQPLQPRPTDLAAIVLGMQDLLKSTLGPNIDIDIDVMSDLPPVIADANQFEMAILNLAVNARDAMPNGGRLTVAAANEEVTAATLVDLTLGDYVRIQVADTGTGMSDETLARAIEPFYSTKGIGKGTGLGLSMVHGLMNQLSGAMSIMSRIGEGTTINLYLPVSAEAAQASKIAASPKVCFSRAYRVLLIDDDELVRGAIAEILSEAGLQVEQIRSASDGMERLSAGSLPDIVVTDHLMPGMTGADLAIAMRESHPGLPVIVVSGYAENAGLPAGLVRLGKPVQRDELLLTINRLCSGDGSGS